MPYYTISAIDDATGMMADEVIEAVDLEMAGSILAARGLSIVSIIGQASQDPRLLAPPPARQHQARPQPPMVVVQQKSVFASIVWALLFVFIGIPLIIFVAVPVGIMLLAWIVQFFMALTWPI